MTYSMKIGILANDYRRRRWETDSRFEASLSHAEADKDYEIT